jgi:cellulose synthase/poly-beta-1,6-N-acetylglucosamine synthase-like glycosyltransferase
MNPAVDWLLLRVLAACVVAVLYPFVLYPLVLMLLPARPLARGGATAPSVSLLFCAYNEARALPAKIDNLRVLKRRHPALEILAYDDGSTDGTGALLDAAQDILTLVRGPGRAGKAHGMKALAKRAGGEVLVFTDANVLLAEDALDRLAPCYADAQVGGVLGSLRYMGTRGTSAAAIGGLYWRIEEILKDLESRSGNVMGADGSIFSIRRALYPDFPDTVLDDMTVSMAVVFAGKRLVKARDVLAYEQMVASREDEYRRKVRIAARSWHTHAHIRPQLREMALVDRFKYASRKMVRWWGGLWMLIGALAAFVLILRAAPLVAGVLLLASVIGVLVAVRARRGPVAAIADILLAYAATLQGIVAAMRGRTFATWTPAKSRD